MQPQLGILKRFIISLLGVDRCSLSWGCRSGLLEVYWEWSDAASAGDLEEVYLKFISGGQMQPQMGSGRGLLEVYQRWTDAASAGDVEEVY